MLKFLSFLFLLTSCGLMEKNNNRSSIHHEAGVAYLKKCQLREALTHLLKAKKFSEDNDLVLYSLAVTYFTLKKYKKVNELADEILDLKPSFSEVWALKAQAQLKQKKFKKALKSILRAQENITYSNQVKLKLIQTSILFNQGNTLQALNQMKKTQELSKRTSCEELNLSAKIHLKLKNYTETKKLMNQALRLCSNHKPNCEKKLYDEHFLLAQAFYHLKLFKKAKYHLKLFLQQTTKNNPLRNEAQQVLNNIKS